MKKDNCLLDFATKSAFLKEEIVFLEDEIINLSSKAGTTENEIHNDRVANKNNI